MGIPTSVDNAKGVAVLGRGYHRDRMMCSTITVSGSRGVINEIVISLSDGIFCVYFWSRIWSTDVRSITVI